MALIRPPYAVGKIPLSLLRSKGCLLMWYTSNMPTVHTRWHCGPNLTITCGQLCISLPHGITETLKRILKPYRVRTVMMSCRNMRRRLIYPKDDASMLERPQKWGIFPCRLPCPTTYVGETRRGLGKRVDEHKRAVQKVSSLAEHAWRSNHRVDWWHVAILDENASLYKRLALELYKKTVPSSEQGQGHVASSIWWTDKGHLALTDYSGFLWFWFCYHHLSLRTLSAFFSLYLSSSSFPLCCL